MEVLGNSSGPHLHFEIRKGGSGYSNTIDPLPYITSDKKLETEENQTQNIIQTQSSSSNNTIVID